MHNNIAIEIIDCFTYNQPNGTKYNSKRDYCALAYRADTDSKYIFDGKALTAPKGAVVFVPSDVAYSTMSRQGKIYAVHFKILNHTYKDIEVVDIENSTKSCEMFLKILEVWNKKERGYQYKAASIFYEILSYTKNTVEQQNQNDLAAICAEYLSDHFADSSLTIDSVAAGQFVSGSYLRKKFQERYGISPRQYLTNRRIEFAKYLIEIDCFSQDEIAERCGFSCVKYFRTAFKKLTGKSVGQYKSFVLSD